MDLRLPCYKFLILQAVSCQLTIYTCWTAPSLTFDLHNKSNARRGSVQQMFYYAEITE